MLLLVLTTLPAAAQRVVSGQVVEAATGAPVPFASVFVPRTTAGVTADVEGRFKLAVSNQADSVAASALGFAVGRAALTAAAAQVVMLRLKAGAGVALGEVVVNSSQPENPAFRILREVQRHKPQNAQAALQAAEFDSYNRTEAGMTDLPKAMANRKVVKDIQALAVRRGASAATDPNAPLPLFAAEVSSRVYQQFSPSRRREDILHRQLRGPGPGENTVLAQLLGGNLQAFDFYPNWQSLLGKDFISPIAEGGRLTYSYELQDSVFIGQDWCYQIGVTPKRPHDLAFTGTIWITAGSYALRRLDVVASPDANINFVSDLRLFQELTPPDQGPGLPTKSRFVIGLRPGKNLAAMQVRFTTINSHFVRNQPRPGNFYDASAAAIESDARRAGRPTAPVADSADLSHRYFDRHRPDTLSLAESQTFAVLDSALQLRSVRSTLDWVELLANGYKSAGKFEYGPVADSYAYNDIEGNRFRVGFRTTPAISRDWLTQAYVAYGTKDASFKYGLKTSYIAERRHWTVFGAEYRHDLEQVALLDNDFLTNNGLFAATSHWGNFQRGRPVLRDLTTLSVQRDLFHGFTQTVLLRYQQLQPLYNFAYYTSPGQALDASGALASNFDLSEIVLQSRYARDENLVQGETGRQSISVMHWPVFTFRYTLGLNNLLQSDFKYHKLNLLVTQSLGLGQLGRLDYRLEGSYIPGALPYPELKIPLGNETPFLNPNAFNLMRYFEFVTDRSVSLRVEQHLQGLLLNAVPGLRALDWRLVASGNVLYGGLSATNRNLLPLTDLQGNPLTPPQSLGALPYAEVGYGVENIFHFVRVDFLHRLTYRDLPGAHNFGVKVTAQFQL
ncbi:DUF5686 family protein [Hymenobacter convexus]|uniref:DUF5686 family protein n=1 Tax=Hymenobacter sp. CA1UV-4 TaxID=3063782 RepID=UPI002713DBAB|nr:DUF5686 family protein [Hymenobacter sp. CA1UV-4]MDO7854066.1 DUF5686 family protein [Hymenobacter sp. CA1UV-4]